MLYYKIFDIRKFTPQSSFKVLLGGTWYWISCHPKGLRYLRWCCVFIEGTAIWKLIFGSKMKASASQIWLSYLNKDYKWAWLWNFLILLNFEIHGLNPLSRKLLLSLLFGKTIELLNKRGNISILIFQHWNTLTHSKLWIPDSIFIQLIFKFNSSAMSK